VNQRVQKLRRQSLEAVPTLSEERAALLTAFYQGQRKALSAPMLRAKAFEYILAHKAICINDGELIVGERGPAPMATPTYPEICCHSLEDLDILDSREKIFFKVSEAMRQTYAEAIIPFWEGRTIRERIFEQMEEAWLAAYEAGVFTEFMEQRAPGHTVLDDKIYYLGMLGFKERIAASIARLDFLNDPLAYDKREELRAMDICADAIITFANRHADLAGQMARAETDPSRRAELEEIAAVCSRVPAHAPTTLREALQYYWFIHLGVITELNPWDSFNPGHLDQHLESFYQAELAQGSLTREAAKELLECFWVKFNNHPAPPKIGVTAQESGTYTDFANINLGGLKPDGTDAVNEVTYLLLEVIEEMRILQPSSNIQLSKKNPERFLKRTAEIIRTGFGQPSIFNADAVVQELVRQGKTLVDARCGGTSGCVETGAFGKENYNLTGYFNLTKVLEITLHNGVDPRSGRLLGPRTGSPGDLKTYEDLWAAFRTQLAHFINIKIRGNNLIERLYAEYLPVPFLSLLISDCIETGLDYHNGGARYNTSYIQGVGIGSLTDSFSAIRWLVYDQGKLSLPELVTALDADFSGAEKLRLAMVNKTPKYGNDDAYADGIMRDIFNLYFDLIEGRPNTKGGTYQVNWLPTTVHVYFGSVIGATPDGRRAGQPLSEGISPVQGADRHGPTAVINSAAKMDHLRTGGTLLNQKFTPQLLVGQNGIDQLAHLVRTYFKKDGHHIQFNVVSAETLREAQQHPEQYRDLIVRVAGYSDYFCNLGRALQDEIISRTEQQSF